MQEQPGFCDTLSVEHVRNAISDYHALSDWKVVPRELTKNVPIFFVLVMLCYFLSYNIMYLGFMYTFMSMLRENCVSL